MASAGEIPALLFLGKESPARLRTGPGPVIGSLGRPETEMVRSSAAGKSSQPGIGLDAQRHAPNLPHEDSDSGHRAGVLGTAEPDVVVPVRWCVPVPVCRSHIVRFIVPGPTADHTIFAARWPFRIPLRTLRIEMLIVPIGCPLPDVPSHMAESIRTVARFITVHRCESLVVDVLGELFPEVGKPTCRSFIAPRVRSAIRAASGLLPLRLRR